MKRYKSRGFSLLELVVTLAIAAILAAFAIPSYQQYVTKAALQEAKAVLGENQLQLETFYSKHRTYKNATIPFTVSPKNATGNAIRYNIGFTVAQNGASYEMTATPTSVQANAAGGGKECGTLTLKSTGESSTSAQVPGFRCF